MRIIVQPSAMFTLSFQVECSLNANSRQGK
jgi:hypothetical protein